MDGGAEAEAQEHAVGEVHLPAGVDVAAARVSVEVERAAERGAQVTAEDVPAGPDQNFRVDVHALFQAEAAPEARNVVPEHAALDLEIARARRVLRQCRGSAKGAHAHRGGKQERFDGLQVLHLPQQIPLTRDNGRGTANLSRSGA